MPSRNSYSVTICGSPPSTIAAFAVVPPMSNTIRSAAPIAGPSRAAPATPPAGPEPTAKTGRSRAVPMPIIPPLDAITCTGAVTPIAASRSASFER